MCDASCEVIVAQCDASSEVIGAQCDASSDVIVAQCDASCVLWDINGVCDVFGVMIRLLATTALRQLYKPFFCVTDAAAE